MTKRLLKITNIWKNTIKDDTNIDKATRTTFEITVACKYYKVLFIDFKMPRKAVKDSAVRYCKRLQIWTSNDYNLWLEISKAYIIL